MAIRVNAIQRFCLHDGPGIRTVVFLQGCPLRCWWCHNPETQPSRSPDAREMGITELAAELERDARYWERSGGGVTLSGGEPLAQADATDELVGRLSAHRHHTAIDTSGHGDAEDVERLSRHVSLWLWDVKTLDPARYREATGGEPGLPLANLAWVLGRSDVPVVVRVPLIADFNASREDLAAIAAWLNNQPRKADVELLPGHSHPRRAGGAGSRRVTVDPAQYRRAVDIMEGAGLHVVGKRTEGEL